MQIVKARKVNEVFNYCMIHHIFNDEDLAEIGKVLVKAIDRVLEAEKNGKGNTESL